MPFNDLKEGQTHSYNDDCNPPHIQPKELVEKVEGRTKLEEREIKDKIFEIVNRPNEGKWSVMDAVDDVFSLLQEQRQQFKQMITEEINVAHSEGQATSRLTSLFNRLTI